MIFFSGDQKQPKKARLSGGLAYVLALVTFLTISLRVMPTSAQVLGEPIQPLPTTIELDQRKVALGDRLFHDPRLSADQSLSCASCHDLDRGGAIPGQQYALPGVNGEVVRLNVPTVFNSGLNFLQTWNGRAASLEEQMDGPVLSHAEMGSNWRDIERILGADPELRLAFEQIYGRPPVKQTIKDAIATFERSLITPNAPFDLYLQGESEALSVDARRGYELFKGYGCVACHQGMNIGGNMLQVFGIIGNYFEDRGEISEHDLGLYNVTGRELDRYVFKVPSLRNVAETAPYFHDGSAADLKTAIHVMARYQLGRELDDEEVSAIEAFLESLTGAYEG
ncbi:MAG: cytochrome-c peroxidase [Geminicoccaceae bacterium]